MSPFVRTSATTFSTSLSVWLTSPEQSGHYHCIPTNTEKATVMLHVLDGESEIFENNENKNVSEGDMLRAMYSNSSRSLHHLFPSLLSSFLLHLICVLLLAQHWALHLHGVHHGHQAGAAGGVCEVILCDFIIFQQSELRSFRKKDISEILVQQIPVMNQLSDKTIVCTV